MKTLIIFYSRTGATRGLAGKLGNALGADLVEIECPRFRWGLFGYLRAGYDSVKGNLPPVNIPQVDFSAYDLVLIGTPIWTSYPALPVRAFLAKAPAVLGRETGLFFTYEEHSSVQQALDEVKRLWPHEIKAHLAINPKKVSVEVYAEAVDQFLETLRCQDRTSAHVK